MPPPTRSQLERGLNLIWLLGAVAAIWLAVARQVAPEYDYRAAVDYARERLRRALREQAEWERTEADIRGLPET